MAGRGRSALTKKPALRPRALANGALRSASLVYTAQDVARFCEVDLKTIHHWADAGKIPHHRTEGRHLRFRRNHLVQFLRAHGYPLHDAITSARPTVFVAAPAEHALGGSEIAKKLSGKFVVRRFEHAATAIANLVHGEPDAIVCALEDSTWSGSATIAALRSNFETSWPAFVVIANGEADTTGADLVIPISEIGRLHTELAKSLGVA